MIYHFNFRFDYNKKGVPSIYVGTLQGSKHGLDSTRALTKKLFGYRPKNFILYLMRILVQTLGIYDLYVITDEGFYSNSHLLRGNRHKLTNFNAFWKDEGAVAVDDERWYMRLPRSAIFSANGTSSWIRLSPSIYAISKNCSAPVFVPYHPPSTKRPLSKNQKATIP